VAVRDLVREDEIDENGEDEDELSWCWRDLWWWWSVFRRPKKNATAASQCRFKNLSKGSLNGEPESHTVVVVAAAVIALPPAPAPPLQELKKVVV
jgi:hypothetical protein